MNPFERHPTARFRWAFERLRGRDRTALDLGIGDASFVGAVHRRTPLQVVGADPHAGYLADARMRYGDLSLVQLGDHLPFADAAFDSVTMLDVLEHTTNERMTWTRSAGCCVPGGMLAVTVPAQHVFSFLDPDNAKFRVPRVHRAVYSARFGAATYCERFQDDSNGLRGDMAWERAWHTNYDTADLLSIVEGAALTPRLKDGANLFWRFWQVPELLAPRRARRFLDAPLRADGRWFRRANLFLTAVRSDDLPPRGRDR